VKQYVDICGQVRPEGDYYSALITESKIWFPHSDITRGKNVAVVFKAGFRVLIDVWGEKIVCMSLPSFLIAIAD
jgi:hypothetical protein